MSDREEDRLQSHWQLVAAGWEAEADRIKERSWPVIEWMVDRLDPKRGDVVLELGAGPGDLGFLATERLTDGHLISSDSSQEMLDIAKRRAAHQGIANVDFRLLDAENIDLEPASVDGVLCKWTYMLLENPQAALRETRRVLRPGGRLVFSVWDTPDKNPWINVIARQLGRMGRVEVEDPTEPTGISYLADPSRREQMVSEAGFSVVETAAIPVRYRFSDFDDFWESRLRMSGSVAEEVSELSEEELKDLRRAVKESVETFESAERYDLPGLTVNVVAQ